MRELLEFIHSEISAGRPAVSIMAELIQKRSET